MCDAIRTVLAAYRSTDARITEEQIQAAWAEYEQMRATAADNDRFAQAIRDLLSAIRGLGYNSPKLNRAYASAVRVLGPRR